MSAAGCFYCGTTDADLRPYGPGASPLCVPCAMETPEREAEAKARFGALLDASDAIGDPLIVGGTPELRRQVLDAIDEARAADGGEQP